MERGFRTLIEEKGLGDKRVNRVGISLSNRYHSKLNKLAVACSVKPTTLAGLLVELSLDNADLVAEIQKDRCKYAAYKVTPIVTYQLYNNRRDDL
jgi:hypothetical protein